MSLFISAGRVSIPDTMTAIKVLTNISLFDNLQNSAREINFGGMAEWFKAAVLKTAVPERDRGFESLSLRQVEKFKFYVT